MKELRASAPGLTIVGVCVAIAFLLNHQFPDISPLVAAVVIGAVIANFGLIPDSARPGLKFAAKRLLRLGVVLLGLQLAVSEVVKLGAKGLVVVVVVVAVTFFGTQWMGRRLGLSRSLSLLIATGFSICGASAIAAMEGVSDAEEEEVAFSIALVTLCGSLAIVVLPLLAKPLGLSGQRFGSWVGASVHDVAQVVATAATDGPLALKAAVVVKLTRVVLLAPMVAGVTISRRRSTQRDADRNPDGAPEALDNTVPHVPLVEPKRPPILPLFVIGFLVSIGIRSTGVLGAHTLATLGNVEKALLAAALVGLGTGVEFAKLRRIGGRPLLLGLVSWIVVAAVAYLGVVVVGI